MRWKMNISMRLMLGFGTVCVFLIVMGLFSLGAMSKVNKTTREITENWMPRVSEAYQMKLYVSEFYKLEGEYVKNGSTIVEQEMAKLKSSLISMADAYVTHAGSKEAKDRVMVFKTDFEAYQSIHDDMVRSVKSGQGKGAQLNYDTTAFRFVRDIRGNLDELIRISEEEAHEAVQSNQREYDQGRQVIFSAMLLVALLSGVLALWTIRSIMKPIRQINSILEDLSGAEGDLSRRIVLHSGDEIQRMGDNVNLVLSTVEHMVQQIRESTTQVASSADTIQTHCEQFHLASDEITLAITKLSEDAAEQLHKTILTQSKVDHSLESLTKVVTYAEDTFTIAQTANLGSDEAHCQLQKILQTMDQTIEQNNITQQSMQAFMNQLVRIEEINQLITNISHQTGILSMNASIEAARAGEHGRGFAVVAQEVRKLANETRRSSDQVVELLEQLRVEMAVVNRQFEQNTQYIEEGSHQIEELLVTFESIRGSNETVMHNGERTLDEVHLMRHAVNNLAEIFIIMGQIANDQTASSEEIAASAEEQNSGAQTILFLTETLNEQSKRLELLVSKFKTSEDSLNVNA